MDGFLREAQTIARLSHPNIIRVLDFGVDSETPYLVMDYAPNGTLRQRHPKNTPITPTTVVSYVKQVADALQYAHDEHLIHRDIKQENMLLGRATRSCLSDFGIATGRPKFTLSTYARRHRYGCLYVARTDPG